MQVLLLILLLLCGNIFSEVKKLPDQVHTLALKSIELTYNEHFLQALETAKEIIKIDQSKPTGYFFYAAVLAAYMEFLESDKFEVDFYRYSDLAIIKGEKLLEKNQDDYWANFFIAGSNGNMGTYESRFEKWVTAFKHGWRAVTIFRDLKEKYGSNMDVEYGIATYNYWRSEKTKSLWWMPGVNDNRKESINTLFFVIKDGLYVKESAKIILTDILINEKKYKEAKLIAEKFLKKYPGNLVMNWHLLRCLYYTGKYQDALNLLNKIENKVHIHKKLMSLYQYARIYYYKCTIYFHLNDINTAKQYFKRFQQYYSKLSEIDRKRLESRMAELRTLKRKLSH